MQAQRYLEGSLCLYSFLLGAVLPEKDAYDACSLIHIGSLDRELSCCRFYSPSYFPGGPCRTAWDSCSRPLSKVLMISCGGGLLGQKGKVWQLKCIISGCLTAVPQACCRDFEAVSEPRRLEGEACLLLTDIFTTEALY